MNDDKLAVIWVLLAIAIAALALGAFAIYRISEADTMVKVLTLSFTAVSSIVSGLLGVAVGRQYGTNQKTD